MKFLSKLLVFGTAALAFAAPAFVIKNNINEIQTNETYSNDEIETYEVTTNTLLYVKLLNTYTDTNTNTQVTVHSTSVTMELYFNPQDSGTDFIIEYRITEESATGSLSQGQWTEYVAPFDDGNNSVEVITLTGLTPDTNYTIEFKLNRTIEQKQFVTFTTGSTINDYSADGLESINTEIVTDDTAELQLTFETPVMDTNYFIEYSVVEYTGTPTVATDWVTYLPHENDPTTFVDYEQIVIDDITPNVPLEPSTTYDVHFRINGVEQNRWATITTRPDTPDIQYISSDPTNTVTSSTPTRITFELVMETPTMWTPNSFHLIPTIEYSYKVTYPGGTESEWSPYFISYSGTTYNSTSKEVEETTLESVDGPTRRSVVVGANEAPLTPGTTYQVKFRIDGQEQLPIFTVDTASTINANPENIENIIIEEIKTNEITLTIDFSDTLRTVDTLAYSINGGKIIYYPLGETYVYDGTETITIKNLKSDTSYTITFFINEVKQDYIFTFTTPIVNNLTAGAATAIIISVIAGVILISMGAYTVYYFKFKDKFK